MTVPREKRLDPNVCITVLLVDDHKDIRTELRNLLDAESDILMVGEAANGQQAVERAMKLSPTMAKSFNKRTAHL